MEMTILGARLIYRTAKPDRRPPGATPSVLILLHRSISVQVFFAQLNLEASCNVRLLEREYDNNVG